MTHLGVLGNQRPIPTTFFEQGADFEVQGLFSHAPSLGKFSLKSKEHFTKRLGQPRLMTEGASINRVLARNLAYWMSEAKLTQSALAEKAGVSQKTISNYLNPDQRAEGSKGKEPSAKITELDKIASALSIGVWQLLRDQTDSERKMYRAIEEHYATLRKEVVTAATEDAENKLALENAKVTSPAKVARKKSA